MKTEQFEQVLVAEVSKPRRMRYACEAEDAVQMAAQRAIERFRTGELADLDAAAFSRWFNRQVHTQARLVQRKAARKPLHCSERPELIQQPPQEQWIRAAIAEALPECLQEVPDYLASGHGQKVTAKAVGTSERQVRQAVAKLRIALG